MASAGHRRDVVDQCCVDVVQLCARLEATALLDPNRIVFRAVLGDILDVEADETLLTVALTTLLGNAFRFTRAGGTVTLRARREGRRALFEVEDECGGLSPRRLNDLLTPFAQAAKDRSGVGVGLTAARDAVESQGGELTIRNKPGAGCVFGLALPHDRLIIGPMTAPTAVR